VLSYNCPMSESKPPNQFWATLATGLFLASLTSLFFPSVRLFGMTVLFGLFWAVSYSLDLQGQFWSWAFQKVCRRR
jgi:hypothetical protein